MAALLLTVHPAPGSAAKRISSAIRCLDGVGDAGEFFGDGPQSALDVPIVRLCIGSHELRVAAGFEKAAWPKYWPPSTCGSVAARSVGRAPMAALWSSSALNARTGAEELRANSVLEPPGCAATEMVVLLSARRRCSP